VKTNLENNKRKQREQKQLVRNQKTIETMKTRINQLVVVALFALLMLGGNVSAKGTELVVSSRENVEEPALLIENWMVDANYWNTADANVELTDAAEEGLELENWMIDGKVWNTENSVVLENETEQELAIEAWMVDENIWN
jgi:hypothetical protein